MTRTKPLALAGILAASMALSAPALAQGKPKGGGAKPAAAAADKGAEKNDLVAAKKHYADGEAKFKMGAYNEALTEFQAADAIKSTPQSQRYIGSCYDNLGRFPEAVTAYERFLANVPPKMASEGDKIKGRVDQIKQLPAKLHVTSDPTGASIALDGKPQTNATPTDLDVPPGHHTLHFTAPGHDPADKDVDATFASKQDVSVTLPASAAPPVAAVVPPPAAPVAAPPAEPPPPPPAAEPEHHSKLPAYITGGLAIAAAGVGTVFGVMALSDKSDFDSNPTTSKADDGENHALIADMAFGVAITLGVTSAVLFLSSDDSPPAATGATSGAHVASSEATKKKSDFSITPSPIVTAHGAGAGALIRF